MERNELTTGLEVIFAGAAWVGLGMLAGVLLVLLVAALPFAAVGLLAYGCVYVAWRWAAPELTALAEWINPPMAPSPTGLAAEARLEAAFAAGLIDARPRTELFGRQVVNAICGARIISAFPAEVKPVAMAIAEPQHETREEHLHRVLSELAEEGIPDAFGDPIIDRLEPTVANPVPATSEDVEALDWTVTDDDTPEDLPPVLAMASAASRTVEAEPEVKADPFDAPEWTTPIPYTVAEWDVEDVDARIPFVPTLAVKPVPAPQATVALSASDSPAETILTPMQRAVAAVLTGAAVRTAAREHGVAESSLRWKTKRARARAEA